MILTLSPQRRDDLAPLALARTGDAITINGETFDFAPLAEGDVLPREAVACAAIVADVTRQDGAIRLALLLPLGPNAGVDARFPAAIVNPPDGPIGLPDTHPATEGTE